MILGYARVSSQDQNLERQIEALTKAKCQYIYQEKMSGIKQNRPELRKMLTNAQATDIIVVQKLDRLGRSLTDLLSIIDDLNKRNIQFVSLTEGFDTRTPVGKMMFQVVGAMAEFERNLIVERVNDGMKNSRLKGTKSGIPTGRPRRLETMENIELVKVWIEQGVHVKQMAEKFTEMNMTKALNDPNERKNMIVKPNNVYRLMSNNDLTEMYQDIQSTYGRRVVKKKTITP